MENPRDNWRSKAVGGTFKGVKAFSAGEGMGHVTPKSDLCIVSTTEIVLAAKQKLIQHSLF